MKTPEDEAFDEIERRQGGGFKAKQAMAMDKVSPFEKWWYYEGSGPPQKGEDYEEHTKRMCEIAWSNGADVAAQPAQEFVADSFEEYCKTLHPLWNTHISRTYAEQFFRAGQSAQPAQEPVEEWPGQSNIESQHNACQHRGYCKQLKAQPPLPVQPVQREWVGLTPEEINAVNAGFTSSSSFHAGALWAQAKLKEKNA